MTRLTVELPVCPEESCRHIGKVLYDAGLKGFCTGSPKLGTGHRKRRMVPVVFAAEAPDAGEGDR